MASSSSDPGLKPESSGGGGGGGGGESSEAAAAAAAAAANDPIFLYRGLKKAKKERGCTAKERISKMPPCAAGKRSSIYRGVTRHRWTGRYEAHLWDKSTWNQNQNKKGKQVYLGAYDDEEAAARAYDLAALKYWGPGTLINFPVTDYTRDLEEMQNVSREEYLASLRRKSSGFSRGISKCRGLSSRWEPSFSRMPGSEYLSSIHYGTREDPGAESEFVGSICFERKIDLTNHIKWWGPKKNCQGDAGGVKSSEETKHGCPGDIGGELRTLERAVQPTEPYQMPQLGIASDGKKHKGSNISALSILSRSPAYKSLQEKVSKKQESNGDNDENRNKNAVNKMDHGKAVEKSIGHDGGSEGIELGMSGGGLSLQRNMFPLTPLLSAQVVANFNAIDPLVDPVVWASLAPVLPSGIPRTGPEVTKTESSSNFTLYQPGE